MASPKPQIDEASESRRVGVEILDVVDPADCRVTRDAVRDDRGTSTRCGRVIKLCSMEITGRQTNLVASLLVVASP